MAKRKAQRPTKSELKAVAVDNETVQVPALLRASPVLAAAVERTISYTSAPPKTTAGPQSTGLKTVFAIEERDSFDAAERLVGKMGGQNVAVLNMANALQPGGGHQGDPSGYLTGIAGQEQSLCRRSTLYTHINRPGIYPIGEAGALWSKGVRVFRRGDAERNGMLDEGKRYSVNVISVAALDRRRFGRGKAPPLSEEEEETTFEKIVTVLRVAKIQRQHAVVLGAFGCGAFNNPPREIARLFLRALTHTAEFNDTFRQVTFAIRDSSGANWKAFAAVWKEVLDAQAAAEEDSVDAAGDSSSSDTHSETERPPKKRVKRRADD